MSEEELPEELDKLEITPIVKLEQLRRDFNPFCNETVKGFDISAGTATASIETEALVETKHLRPISHRITRTPRTRRRSESELDEYKLSNRINEAELSASHHPLSSSRLGSMGVHKPQFKKSLTPPFANKVRKFVLREPILKALQTCLQSPMDSGGRSNLHLTSTEAAELGCKSSYHLNHSTIGNLNVASFSTPPPPPPAQSCVSSQQPSQSLVNQSTTLKENKCKSGTTDFRDLIQECQKLLEEDTDSVCRCKRHRHASKNFTTLRSDGFDFASGNTLLPLKSQEAAVQIEPILNSITLSPPSSLSCSFDTSLDHLQLQQQQQQQQYQQSLMRTNSSTTCSQQAGNGASVTSAAASIVEEDMVNMNELAGYFETIVHIPKKMSSMAEMMYI